MDTSTAPSKAAQYLADTREELVRKEVRFNSAYKLNGAEIEEACRQSQSDMHQAHKEMMLTHFVRAVRSMTGAEPPKEYYPEIVDILMKDLQANMHEMPSLQPKDMASNTIRYGAAAAKLKEDFPDIDNGVMVETAMRGYMKPRAYLEGIQHNFDRLCKHFTDENAYPRNVLVHKAFRETHGIGIEAASKTPDTKLFSGVRARSTGSADDIQPSEAMTNARDAILSTKRVKREIPSGIIQTYMTNNPETVEAICRKVDGALGEHSRRVVTNWQGKVTQKAPDSKEPQK